MKFTNSFQKLLNCFSALQPNSTDANILPASIVSLDEMRAIANSINIYRGFSPWLSNGSCGLELASGISSELARLVVAELSFDLSVTSYNNLIQNCFDSFFSKIRIYTEYACASGGVMFKPCFNGNMLSVECLLPFDFIPLETDGSNKIISCAFIYTVKRNNKYFTRIEEHRRVENGYVILNRVFSSDSAFFSGKACPLSDVYEWASISPRVFIKNLSEPLFSYFSMPLGNSCFPDSPLGIPVFRRAENLIKQSDIQFNRLLWEFEGGELAVDASEDAFRIGKNGKPELPLGKERLYRCNSLDACVSTNDLISTFAPNLRDKSLINGLNRIIMFVEDSCGISRGTFSDPSDVAKTATEVKSMRQKTYSTVCSIQNSLNTAIFQLLNAVNSLSYLYSISSSEACLDVRFGDGILNDLEDLRSVEREDVKCGILSPDEFKKRWY